MPETSLVITGAEVEQYIYRMLPGRDDVLKEMEEQARRRDIPIVGPAVGRVFYLLARMVKARRIFELGSAIGYSTIWWTRGAGPQGEVYYTDSSQENAREASAYFRRAGVEKQVHVLVGDAIQQLQKTEGEFDIVFLDVDKDGYPAALKASLPRLKKGGLLVADNVLWHGEVGRENGADAPASLKGILEFNQKIYSSRELFPVILPLRDGVAVAIKE